MADDFDAGSICNGSWWSAAARIGGTTTAGFDVSGMGTSSLASCSSAIADTSAADALMPMSGFGLSPAPPMDWNQPLLSDTGRDDQTSFHHLLQEAPDCFRQEDPSSLASAKEANRRQQQQQQQFLLGQQQRQFFEPAASSLMAAAGSSGNGYQANDSLAKFAHLLEPSPTKNQQLQFTNDAPFWNPSAVQFVARSFEPKPNCGSTTTKSNNTYSGTKRSSSSSTEASLKKPRIETPSPLPTFKVRKEKLGDRITALQQLVSPFGKTDTASVLHEAIEYIKFLHEQVNVLSTPYLKNGHSMQHQQNSDKSKDACEAAKHDLRSWGLCLVPTESIYPVASETMTDFWTPTFGGSYR